MLTVKRVFFYISLLIFTNWHQVPAQSIAASLAEYQKTVGYTINGISGTSFSGVTFYYGSATLYVVDDANTTVYEIDTAGGVIRSISLSGFQDTEGIAYQSGSYFFIIEERLANLVRVTLPQSGPGPVDWNTGVVLSIADDWGNTGLEGVTYCVSTQTVYLAKEIDPPTLYRVTLDTNGDPDAFFENDPFTPESYQGDIADLYALSDGNFILVNQEENKLIGCSGTGEILSELLLGMTKPEGITVDTSDNTIYIVGEPRELFVFKPLPTARQIPHATKTSCIVSPPHRQMPGSSITFHFYACSAVQVVLEIIDVRGKRIETLVNKRIPAGAHHAVWHAQNCPAGIYLYRFKAGVFTETGDVIVF